MISLPARDGFDHLLTQAIKANLVSSCEDRCDVTILSDLSEINETKIVMLTISSYLFRLMVFIYFTPNIATKEHFARINRIRPSDMSEQLFYDSIAEYGNICCGAINRNLVTFFPHISMSTPNIIDKNCSSHLDVLGCSHIQHFKASVNNVPPFHFSLGVCNYAALDFAVDDIEESAETGELEFF